MSQAKTRKVGNSVMISIPKELHPEINKEYIITRTKNGAFIMAPKISNPFSSNEDFQDSPSLFELQAMKGWEND